MELPIRSGSGGWIDPLASAQLEGAVWVGCFGTSTVMTLGEDHVCCRRPGDRLVIAAF